MTKSADWAAHCTPGTIVSFRFPQGEDGKPGKARPCLVVATKDSPYGKLFTIVYGTTSETAANRGLDLLLGEPGDWQASGLHRASRFVVTRRVTISVDSPGFDTGAAASPIIGIIPAHQQDELRWLVRTLGARLQDDAPRGLPPERAERGCSRRRPHRLCRDCARSTPVIVEHRHRKLTKHPASAG